MKLIDNYNMVRRFSDTCYYGKRKHLDYLIEKRGDQSSNLSKVEQCEHAYLMEWHNKSHTN